MKGNRAHSIDDLRRSFKRIRDIREGFITNLFLNPFIWSIWIKHKLITKVTLKKTDFYLRKDHDFNHLYYCSASKDALSSDVSDFLLKNKDKLFVTDVIGSNIETKDISDLFLSNSFNYYTSLLRMTRILPASTMKANIIDDQIQEAQEADLLPVIELLKVIFDPYSDRLPHIDELRSLKEKGNILLFKIENEIKGFFIFEDLGYTCQFRYWFVDPVFRKQGIGSRLMNSGLSRNRKFMRQISWVPKDNHNSVKCHLHYGFSTEDMVDMILTNKKMTYGKGNN